MRVTMRDIAARAGVSIPTVSRVLRDPASPWAGVATRRLILETARRLGYRPNTHARALTGTQTSIIHLVSWHTRLVSHAWKIVAFQQALDELERTVLITDPGRHATPDLLLEELVLSCPEAVVFVLSPDLVPLLPVVARLRERCVNVLVFDYDELKPRPPGLPADLVTVDRADGACQAVRHLIGAGHRAIGLLHSALTFGRAEGYRRALAEAGLDGSFRLETDGTPAAAEAEAPRFLKRHPEVTALFCETDLAAAAAMRGVMRAGLRVPEDVAFAGFDGDPWAAYLPSPLTTVVQPVDRLCRAAVDLLRRRQQEREESLPALPWQTLSVKPELLVRESCGSRLRQAPAPQERG